ncbi:hypothetical protein O181_046794 [Austropuccinia psidii MF-1]|uniref:Uncharacterized protein n=1 Tax=Austropuccinia psidii MF-1 TaxID=1389203 RepID=A0A9Q3DPM6_9BASI|nr:hypothetical protein [Austropuccinia psidii MF-1]
MYTQHQREAWGSLPLHVISALVQLLGDPNLFISRGPAGMWHTNLEKNPNQKVFIERFLKFNLYRKINITIPIVLFIFQFSSSGIDIFDLIRQISLLIHQPVRYNSSENCGYSLISHMEPKLVISSQNIFLSPELHSQLLKIPIGNDLPQIQSLIPFLKTSLKTHQKQGLAFFLGRETPNGKS